MALEPNKGSGEQLVTDDSRDYVQLKSSGSESNLSGRPPPPPYRAACAQNQSSAARVRAAAWHQPPKFPSSVGVGQASGPRFPAPRGGLFQSRQTTNSPKVHHISEDLSHRPGSPYSDGIPSAGAPSGQSSPVSVGDNKPPTSPAYHSLPPAISSQPQYPSQRVARKRGRPRLDLSLVNAKRANTGQFANFNVPPPVRIKDEPTVNQAPSHNPISPFQAPPRGSNAQDVLLSPSTPAFIDTDFDKDLFAEAEQQLAEMQTSKTPLPDLSEIMDLSTSGELPITSPSPNQVQPSLASQGSHLVSPSHPSSVQQINQKPFKPGSVQNAVRPTAATFGQNLIVQQYPVQSVSPQQIIPLNSQPHLAQAQPAQAHGGLSQTASPVVQGQQVLQGALTQASVAAHTGLAQAQVRLPLTQLRLPLTQLRLPQGSIRLSQPGTPVSLSQAQISTARAISPGQALSLIPSQQMSAVSLSLTSAQTVLGQAQPTAVTMASAAHAQQATFINMNPPLAAATLISQPIQMLTTSGYQQVVSTPVQLTAGQGGQTVLMPLHQPGSVINPASVGQVFNTVLNKTIQPRPSAVLSMANSAAALQGGKVRPINAPGGTPTVTQATPVPVIATGYQTPRTPNIQTQQVLNIPRLRFARPGQMQAIRRGTAGGDSRHAFVLQQPMRSPPDKASALHQIRPRSVTPLNAGETKILAIQPRGSVLLSSPVAGLSNSIGIALPTSSPAALHNLPAGLIAQPRVGQDNTAQDMPLNLEVKKPDVEAQTIQSPNALQLKAKTDSTQLATNGSLGKSNADESSVKTSIQTATEPAAGEEQDFVWEDYLEETGTESVPPTSFIHVENSLESGIQKGMLVEVTRNVAADAYWLASIVMSCGPLLRLRYCGYEEGAHDFWLDVGSPDMHHVGWGTEAGRKPRPPEGLTEKIPDPEAIVKEKVEASVSVPAYLLDGSTGLTPVDQIKPGQRLELQHELAPRSVWVVRVMENVGGRLLLRYEGTDRAAHDMWLFYVNLRLHPIGWAKENDCIYKPPEGILPEHQNYSEWSEILQAALKEASENAVPSAVFKDQEAVGSHTFQQGWKLEVLHPIHTYQVCPATVQRVVGKFFIVEIDSMLPEDGSNPKVQLCCHGKSPNIFPTGWAQSNGIRLNPPTGWKDKSFDWETYLTERNAVAAPETAFNNVWPEHEFARSMKLEVANPAQPGQICAASITRIIGHLLWIHLDSCAKIMANHIVPITSQEIFPIGWCASNGYPLKPPRLSCFQRPGKKVAVVQPDRRSENTMSADEYRNATWSQIKAGDAGGSWCPKIYFNHRCFSGPFLSKGRIAELPRCVGPGPIPLVLKEVLSMLINVAYKSSRVLRELQQEGPPDPRMQSQTLKAKYKGKSYCATVELCRTTGQIEQFCRSVCQKLECCPNLFSANFVNGNCPENCSQLTKTKYTCYYGKKKKRKIGRPPGGHSNLENGPMKFGKRRRKRRMNLIVRKKSTTVDTPQVREQRENDDVFEDDKSSRSTDTHSTNGQNDQDGDFVAKKKRKYEHRTLPPSIIKTRGAKLPRYSFERRTHKKIMLSPPPAGRNRTPEHQSAIVMSPKKEPLYKEEEIPKLDSNPLYWSVMDVVRFIKTTDCAHLARLFRDQAIDGQALLLLTLPAVQDHLDLKLGPAIKLCHHIEQVKIAFYEQFAK